ncbi:MAG: hypothetical protein UMU75_01975, partial [Halomonas sp.]|nr:hypothetical protein [Halomonas sp.]
MIEALKGRRHHVNRAGRSIMGSVALHGISSVENIHQARQVSPAIVSPRRHASKDRAVRGGSDRFSILFVTPEIADFVKVG